MIESAFDSLANCTIGIIGCGHLGRTLANELVSHGLPKEKLMISYGGSASTLESIKRAGLFQNISNNERICRKSNIIFIAVRPQAIEELKKLSFPGNANALVVSCMAGISSASLKNALGIDVIRMMPSGPDTIKEGNCIVAVYPRNDFLANILSGLGLKFYELRDEEMMHAFTVGVCLPAALLVAGKIGMSELDTAQASKIIGKEYPDFEEIYRWAVDVLPDFDSDDEREEYLRRTSTKGGITEAIVDSLNSGSTFTAALRKGISRSKEISAGHIADHTPGHVLQV